MNRLAQFVTALALCSLGSAPQAATPTSEDEAHKDYAWTHAPIWISADGAWRLSLSANGELLREAQDGKAPAQRLHVGFGVRALASWGDGHVVWAVHDHCLLQVDFRATPPALQLMGAEYCTLPLKPFPEPTPDYEPRALAVSADGRWLAWGQDGQVVLTDLRSRTELRRHPLGASALSLRFEDEGQRLAVLSALRGEHDEDFPDPSELQWTRWDLRSGALWNEAQRPGSFGTAADYLHSASSVQQFWLDAKAGVQALDLSSCPARVRSWPLPKGLQVQSLAAEPQGRWLAVLAAAGKSQRLLWLDARNGQLLHSSPLPPERGAQGVALAAFRHGLLLRRVSAVPQAQEQWNQNPWRLQAWQALPVPPALRALPARAAQPTALCRAPDEDPLARQPELQTRPPQLLWSVGLPAVSNWTDTRPGCNGSDWSEAPHLDHTPRRWGLSPAGELWLDHGAELQRLDPASGQVLARWPTPRAAGVCSTPSFARAQFLNWQADTLSLRPFAAQLDAKARTTPERRPGWQVHTAVWLGDQVLARWVRPGQAEQRLYRATASGTWAVASQRTGELREGIPWFEGDEGITSLVGWHALMPDDEAIEAVAREERGMRGDGPRWSAGRYLSVRADEGDRLRLWDGVSGAALSAGGVTRLIDLGHGRAVAFAGGTHHYRLREGGRAPQVARSPRSGSEGVWEDAQWWEAAQLLLMQRIGGELVALRLP